MFIALLTRNRTLTVCGRRIHHGLAGGALILIGAALMLDDLHDRGAWLTDFYRR